MFANGKTIMRKGGGGVFVGDVWRGVVIQHGSIVNSCHYIRTSLSPCLSLSIIRSVRRRKALNKQPVELSQLEPFSIITSSTILNLHCIYLAGGLDNVAKKRVTLAADDNN